MLHCQILCIGSDAILPSNYIVSAPMVHVYCVYMCVCMHVSEFLPLPAAVTQQLSTVRVDGTADDLQLVSLTMNEGTCNV